MARLNAKNLGDYLTQIFPNTTWVYNKKFTKFGFKPTYRCDELKLCVYFDDAPHYINGTYVMEDGLEDYFIHYTGYTTVRIPYYIQMDKQTIKALFGVDSDVTNKEPHGFSPSDICPASFCENGLKRFENEVQNKFNFLEEKIYKSVNEIASAEIEEVLSRVKGFLSKDAYEEEQHDFDHIFIHVALGYMSQEILSQTMMNGGKYTEKFF